MRELHEIRCPHCQKLLAKANIGEGTLEIRCGKCGHTANFSYIKASTQPRITVLDTYGEPVEAYTT